MNFNILAINRQKGVNFDVEAVAQELHEVEEELFAQHGESTYKGEHIFNLVKGRLALYNGGYDSRWEMGEEINTWGYSGKYMLEILAKHMTAGEVMFTENAEGSGVSVWVVTPNKVDNG